MPAAGKYYKIRVTHNSIQPAGTMEEMDWVMSGIQNFFIKILPQRWAQDMEAQSRSWMLKCSNFGAERSVWETGGIRWKASGNPSRMMRCPNCGKFVLHTMYKKP